MDMKDQIIIVATELFMKQGYHATSTREIARILKVTQPAIYHHFKHKEEIYTAVLSNFAIDIGASLQSILDITQDKRSTLIEMARFLKKQHPMNFSLMMHDIDNELSLETRAEIFKIWQSQYFSPFIQYFESIEDCIRPDLSLTVVSLHFLRIVSAYIMDERQDKLMPFLKIEDMVDIYLRGIIKNDSYASLT